MFQGDRGTRGTLHKTGLYFMCIYTLICYFTYLNSPVFYGPTPIVPEGAEHRLGGLHPGAPSLASLPAAARASRPGISQPTTTLLGFVADLLKWLGAISRFLNIYTILIAMESPLATERFAFETCTQAPSDMCITTILFKWQQAVVELIQFVMYFRRPITNKIPSFYGFSFTSIRFLVTAIM